MSDLTTVFGPETKNADEHAGALAPSDAKLLLLPVRSLAGVFAWVTSNMALQRFVRDYCMTGAASPGFPPLNVGIDEAKVAPQNTVIASGNTVVLEEFSFTASKDANVQTIGDWLANNALPTTSEYTYWKTTLPQRLVILHDDAFRDFTQFGTEVQTHIKIDQNKKTAQKGALWTAEYLPADTLLYAPLCATPPRDNSPTIKTAQDVLNKITALDLKRMQLGGDESTGHGIVAVRF